MVRKTERKPSWNYLRVRGEYRVVGCPPTHRWELPPRARRILCARCQRYGQPNYLRVRGEYWQVRNCSAKVRELPPRARRIRNLDPGEPIVRGTTSACAENTINIAKRHSKLWNYLRVRGEYAFLLRLLVAGAELPPRARRIQRHTNRLRRGLGTTSACAENTKAISAPGQYFRNYLRVRGEYTASARTAPDLW